MSALDTPLRPHHAVETRESWSDALPADAATSHKAHGHHTSPPSATARRKGVRSRTRRRRGPFTALAWLLVATLIVLGRRPMPRATVPPAASAGFDTAGAASPAAASGPASGTAPAGDAIARHAPVTVSGEWWHAPVRIVATPPSSATPLWARDLPKPFAAMRTFASPLIMPRLRLPRVLAPEFSALRGLASRARPGEPVHVTLTAYCLNGTTRQGTHTRAGVVAADPRIFPLSRHVELFAAGRYLGRFRVEDTGSAVQGPHIDIWTPDCADARRFGQRSGIATLTRLGEP